MSNSDHQFQALITALCAIFFMFGAVANAWGPVTTRLTWEKVPATVTSNEWVELEGEYGVLFRAVVRYRYSYAGAEHESDRYYLDSSDADFATVRDANAFLDDLPEGRALYAYVNPSNPGESVIDGQVSNGVSMLAMLSLLALLLLPTALAGSLQAELNSVAQSRRPSGQDIVLGPLIDVEALYRPDIRGPVGRARGWASAGLIFVCMGNRFPLPLVLITTAVLLVATATAFRRLRSVEHLARSWRSSVLQFKGDLTYDGDERELEISHAPQVGTPALAFARLREFPSGQVLSTILTERPLDLAETPGGALVARVRFQPTDPSPYKQRVERGSDLFDAYCWCVVLHNASGERVLFEIPFARERRDLLS